MMLVFNLFQDYRRDPKQHTLAKAVHTFLVMLLGYAHADHFQVFIGYFLDFDLSYLFYTHDVGTVPRHWANRIHMTNVILSVLIWMNCLKLMRRSELGRIFLLMLLPMSALFKTVEAYLFIQQIGWPMYITYIGTIIITGITTAIWVTYTRPFMVAFFSIDKSSKQHLERQVEPLIEEFGENNPPTKNP